MNGNDRNTSDWQTDDNTHQLQYLLSSTYSLLTGSGKTITTNNDLSKKEILNIEKEAQQMIDNLEVADVVEFCGTPADEEDKEFLKMAYERFLSDVRVYNKMKYTPKKYKK